MVMYIRSHKLVYRKDPHRLLQYIARSTYVEAIYKVIQERDVVLQDARERLMQTQQRLKNSYDSAYRELKFEVGVWVWLKLHPIGNCLCQNKNITNFYQRFFSFFKEWPRKARSLTNFGFLWTLEYMIHSLFPSSNNIKGLHQLK